MKPVEAVYVTIAIIFAFIGVARTYARELGNTLVILVAIFLLTLLEARAIEYLTLGGERIFDVAGDATNLFLSLSFTILFVSIVFASYSGRTFGMPSFGGRPLGPPEGTLLSLAIGLINGYLVAGTLWYYQDRFGYPFQRFGWITLPLTPTGAEIVALLPQRLFDSPIYWMVPVAVLIVFLVRG